MEATLAIWSVGHSRRQKDFGVYMSGAMSHQNFFQTSPHSSKLDTRVPKSGLIWKQMPPYHCLCRSDHRVKHKLSSLTPKDACHCAMDGSDTWAAIRES